MHSSVFKRLSQGLPGLVIIVGAEKGGVAKSTLAQSFSAAIAADQSLSVALVDMDSTRSTTDWVYYRGQKQDANLSSISAYFVDSDTLDARGAVMYLEPLVSKHDVVVVDIGARDQTKIGQLSLVADLWVMPTSVGQSELNSTARAAVAFDAIDPERTRQGLQRLNLHMVLVKVPNSTTEGFDAFRFLAGSVPNAKQIGQTILKDRKAWRDASKMGLGITELVDRDGKSADEFVKLLDECIERLSQKGVK